MTLETLLIATHNQGKVAEFDKLLDGLGVTLKSAADFDLPEPEETEDSFVGNALLKARAAVAATGLPCLADDSGLAVEALDGAPGIYSARWAETSFLKGSRKRFREDAVAPPERDFKVAMQRVHDDLKKINKRGIDGSQSAYFIAVLALVYPDAQGNISEEIFEGRINGKLCWPARGEKGFGYDSIFVPEGHEITFSEMEPEEKQAISHRAKAVGKFKNYLLNNA